MQSTIITRRRRLTAVLAATCLALALAAAPAMHPSDALAKKNQQAKKCKEPVTGKKVSPGTKRTYTISTKDEDGTTATVERTRVCTSDGTWADVTA